MSADNNDTSASKIATPAEPMAALQSEVMTAVRGAISNAMAGQGKGLDLTGIDLDFAAAGARAVAPVLLAKPDQALAVVRAEPTPRPKTGSNVVFASAVTLALGSAAAGLWLQGPFQKLAPADATPVVVAAPVAASIDGNPTQQLTKAIVAMSAPMAATPVVEAVTPVKLTSPAPLQPAPDRAIRARALLESGEVREARALLLTEPETNRSDVAWTLARSFDGNYLSTLSKSDATADSSEARRWYQRWFELASKEGSVAATARLDRLLQTLP
jgi:hypothetical protein